MASPQIRAALQRLFDCLMQQAGVDFSHCKLPTMMRRIECRMAVLELHGTVRQVNHAWHSFALRTDGTAATGSQADDPIGVGANDLAVLARTGA